MTTQAVPYMSLGQSCTSGSSEDGTSKLLCYQPVLIPCSLRLCIARVSFMLNPAQLSMLLCVMQHACQRGDLHADLKAFRQTVFKKVYKEHKDPKERQKAAISGRAGERFLPAKKVSVLPRIHQLKCRAASSVLSVTTRATLAGPSLAACKGPLTAVRR